MTAVAGRPSEAAAGQRQQRVENAPRVRIHDHRGAELYFSRPFCRDVIERLLPGLDDVDAETPGFGSVGLVSPDDAGEFVVRSIVSMGVNRGRARLKPDRGGSCRFRDRSSHRGDGLDSRLEDFPPVLRRVAAIHRPSCQIDDHVGAGEVMGPPLQPCGVPFHHAPRCRFHSPGQDRDFVTITLEGARQERPNLPRPSRNRDFHRLSAVPVPTRPARGSRRSDPSARHRSQRRGSRASCWTMASSPPSSQRSRPCPTRRAASVAAIPRSGSRLISYAPARSALTGHLVSRAVLRMPS